jgi:primase-polymerase (primpol)-like protein
MEFTGRGALTSKTGVSTAQEKVTADDGKVVAMDDFVQSRNAKAALDSFARGLSQFKVSPMANKTCVSTS